MIKMPMIIFAGGKSSRMGKDKALLPFANSSSLVAFQHHRLSKLFDTVYISAKNDKFDFECTVISDSTQTSSPLVALISVLESLNAKEVFVLSVDAPFVGQDVIEEILANNEDVFDCIIAKSPSGVQPLCGIYKQSSLSKAKKHLKDDNHRLQDLLTSLKTCYVPFIQDTPFKNINYPREYAQALLDIKG
jgi:molybdopterin-guanine dinucleotide biosynthesis protein A